MYRDILTILRCPTCRADLTLARAEAVDDDGEVVAGSLCCASGHAWPIEEGVLNCGSREQEGNAWSRSNLTYDIKSVYLAIIYVRWPPVKAGVLPYQSWPILQGFTPLALFGDQGIERLKTLVGDAFVCQRPQMLGWLQLRRIGWQPERMNAFWQDQLFAAMPARTIKQ
jgi:uncharacterized protein YbaR (Trm112 family)